MRVSPFPSRVTVLFVATVTVLLLAGLTHAQPEKEALSVFEQHKNSVVTVELVIRQHFAFMGMGSESEESRVETTGTVIDGTGLTVVALSATDPTGMLSNMMGGMLGDDMQMQSEIADVRILNEGVPIPAAVVLRDRDHDLAFIRPLESVEPPLPHVNLSTEARPGLLDNLVIIERMGRVANRVHALSLTRVKAVVERPRRFYLTETGVVGAPALDLEGRCLGIFVMRMLESRDSGSSFSLSMLTNMQEAFSIILIPGDTILESAAQAPPAGDASTADNAPSE